MTEHGGYGYCSEYPMEQLMRDIKIASFWESTNGIQTLGLVSRKPSLKKGLYFMNLLGEMTRALTTYKENREVKDLTVDTGFSCLVAHDACETKELSFLFHTVRFMPRLWYRAGALCPGPFLVNNCG